MSPIQERVERVRDTEGVFVTPGLTRLQQRLSNQDSVGLFQTWADDPTTKLVAEALKDMALNGTPMMPHSDTLVQYGVTVGLSLAVQMMEDPSLVVPGLFGTRLSKCGGPPEMTFDGDSPLDTYITAEATL